MASNKRDVCRKEGEVRGEKAGEVFFRKQPRKTRGNRQNMNYKKLGMEGRGEVVEGTQNCIKDITGTTTVC
jgi:hypothetical protein